MADRIYCIGEVDDDGVVRFLDWGYATADEARADDHDTAARSACAVGRDDAVVRSTGTAAAAHHNPAKRVRERTTWDPTRGQIHGLAVTTRASATTISAAAASGVVRVTSSRFSIRAAAARVTGRATPHAAIGSRATGVARPGRQECSRTFNERRSASDTLALATVPSVYRRPCVRSRRGEPEVRIRRPRRYTIQLQTSAAAETETVHAHSDARKRQSVLHINSEHATGRAIPGRIYRRSH